jgi:hypothetical protein
VLSARPRRVATGLLRPTCLVVRTGARHSRVALLLSSTIGEVRRGPDQEEVIQMGAVLILAFLVLTGPLSYFFGGDSRRSTDRGWVGSAR